MNRFEEVEAARKFKAELVKAMIDLDIEWSKRFLMKNPTADDFLALRSLHEVRAHYKGAFPAGHEHLPNCSMVWLMANDPYSDDT